MKKFTHESSGKHLWNALQDTQHGNQIWKSVHRGHCWHPGLDSLRSCTTEPPFARGRWWLIWSIVWRNWHLPPLGWLARAIATACEFKIYHTPIPHLQKNCHNSQISFSISPWCSNQPPQSSEEPVHKNMQACMDTLHATQRESNLTTTMLLDTPHIWLARLFKVGRLVHRYRDHCWHPSRKTHTPGPGQVTWPHLHTHLQGHLKRKALGWNQSHPDIETLQCKYPHLYLKIYGDTTKRQWDSSCLHQSLQNSSKVMCFW